MNTCPRGCIPDGMHFHVKPDNRRFQIGINKEDPKYVLFRWVGCPGGNECRHGNDRCPPEYNTYVWHSVDIDGVS